MAGGGGGGGGGGQLLPEGWHFICHGGGGGEAGPPTPKAMLDPGLHGIYLDFMCLSSSPPYHLHCTPF